METWISFASTPPTLETLTERYRTSRWPARPPMRNEGLDARRVAKRGGGGESRGSAALRLAHMAGVSGKRVSDTNSMARIIRDVSEESGKGCVNQR